VRNTNLGKSVSEWESVRVWRFLFLACAVRTRGKRGTGGIWCVCSAVNENI